MTSASSRLGTFFLIKTFEGEAIEHVPLTKEQFILQAKGLVPSPANKWRIDHFLINKLESCQAIYDQYSNDFEVDCEVVDDVWRLRFDEFPLATKMLPEDPKGWSVKPYCPSERQMEILKSYGIQNMDDPFVGDEAWRLLRDMSDPKWIAHYRGSGE